jgi:hypothetical protein
MQRHICRVSCQYHQMMLADEFRALIRRCESVESGQYFRLPNGGSGCGLYQAECEIQSGQSRVAPSQPVSRIF